MILKNGLYILCLLIFAACALSEIVVQENNHAVPFVIVGASIPVVKIKLNSKDAWFIIDTGASATLINKAYTKYYGIPDRGNHFGNIELNGLGGSLRFQSVVCNLEIGLLKFKQAVFKSNDLNGFFSFIDKSEGISIIGILGSDILSRYNINVNYDTRTISFKIKEKLKNLAVETVMN
jgi:hypothetical protein